MHKSQSTVYPLRLNRQLGNTIKRVASESGLSEASVMRLALVRGLPIVKTLLKTPDRQDNI